MSKVLRFEGMRNNFFGENNTLFRSSPGDRLPDGNTVRWVVKSPDECSSIVVYGRCGTFGTWSIGVEQYRDSCGLICPIPEWQIYIEESYNQDQATTPALIMVVPDDTTMELVE